MFTYVLDEALGILVARHARGYVDFDVAARALGQLGECKGVPGAPKLYMLQVDRDASHPEHADRVKLSAVQSKFRSPMHIAMVTESPIARGVFTLLQLLDRSGMVTTKACADRASAAQWFESKRSGVRPELERLESLRARQADRDMPLGSLRQGKSGSFLSR